MTKDSDSPIPGQHDKTYRLLYSYPEMVEDTLRVIDEPWVDELDFSTLEKMAESHVSERLDLRFEDVVWKVRWRGYDVFLCLLIEFQSTVDPYMVVRILLYVALFYDDLVRQIRDKDASDPDVIVPPEEAVEPGEEPPRYPRYAKLPLVIPLMVYNGRPTWWPSLDMAGVVHLPAEGLGLERFLPQVCYLLLDERRLPEDELARYVQNLFVELVRLEKAASPEEVHEKVGPLAGRIANPGIRRAFATFVKVALARLGIAADELGKIDDDLGEVTNMLAENLIDWRNDLEAKVRKEGREEGREEGLLAGEALVLTRLVQLKFGPLDDATRQRISEADSETLLGWADRVLTAESVDDVFGEG